MSTKADQSSSAPSKVSLVFGVKSKSGFVIPKNKLSGSLIPVFKAGRNNGSGSGNKEEHDIQGQRKTKWNSDFTLDPWVRKTRALAYQTRLDQINKLLKGTTTGEDSTGDYDGTVSPTKASTSGTENKRMQRESQEQLELERREIIGEILNLNPSFKPPADYKPLLKEAKVPVPIKAYPGRNFIHMLLGAERNIQKRLQDEFGAKIRVHAIKKQTGEKREITQAEISEGQSAYEELYIDVFAETYNKLDAAVSLVELLLIQATSVTSSPAQFSSSTTTTDSTIPQFPSYPSSHWAPPVTPRPQHFGPPPHHQFSNSQSFHRHRGPGPQRPPYREAPQMRGPPPVMYNTPPIYPPVQAARMVAAHSPSTPNHAPMRPPYQPNPPILASNNITYQQLNAPMPASNNITYQQPNAPMPASNNITYQQPNGQQIPLFRPGPQNPPSQFNYQTGPPNNHGFQYPRARMGPYGLPSGPPRAGPGQIWNNSARPDGGGLGRYFRAPLGPGRNNNINNNDNLYYDPFLPTSGPVRPRREGKVEADPEYEDLMASVGVK